jgi:hypothetical protein
MSFNYHCAAYPAKYRLLITSYKVGYADLSYFHIWIC